MFGNSRIDLLDSYQKQTISVDEQLINEPLFDIIVLILFDLQTKD